MLLLHFLSVIYNAIISNAIITFLICDINAISCLFLTDALYAARFAA